jgi:hypothetical protein
MNKYHNIKTYVDEIKFSSKKEAARYSELKILVQVGAIQALELQPKYLIKINDVKVCYYVGDFRYFDNETQTTILEDSKGVRTPIYRLKKKLVKAVYGIDILET